ncbi:ABC transporter substrate-binding protein [Halobellus salinus]|uniref:ABC transporter substrate-binding protein n=1 Tax=Halobellus salinus TaxID=931585 RepID=A0A830EE11_9EURY|nr:ABC transporter substrate-binding protein [Halobellus salinus]GGJ16509.1 ABC transporter substrate-binding protein [Halobellus salinus]SMP33958.1 carbohydrate ABC transporter substrate-binding protein, CUT1 family [Halobellus salinus]
MNSAKSRRRFIQGAGAATVAGLAGCSGQGGDGGGDSGSGDSDSGGDDSSGDGTTMGSGGGSDVTIKFWHAMGGDLAQRVDDIVNSFEEQSDGITVETTSRNSYRDNLNATTQAVGSGDPPALSQIFEIGTQLALDSQAFVPVEEIIPSGQIDFDNFLDPVLDFYRVDGELNSMPFNSSNAIMMYNRDAFEEAGLDPDSPPTTYQGVTEAANTLTSETDITKGMTFPNHSWFVEGWMAQQDTTLVNNDNGRSGRATESNLDSDAAENIFEWWVDLYNQDQYLNPGIEAWGEAQQAFLTQETGMIIYSTSSIAPMKQGAADNGFELDTAYLPAPGGNRTGIPIGGASLWVPQGLSDAQQQAAGELLVYITQPEQQASWHRGTGYFPVHEGAISQLEEDGFYEENPSFRTAIDQLNETESTAATSGALMGPFPEVRTIIEEGYVEMIQNEGTDVASALEGVKSDVDSAIQSYNDRVS